MSSTSDFPAPFGGLSESEHQVWDKFIRTFHWGLVASISVALISGFLLDASWIRLHLAAGTLAVTLVAARIIWGFTGPSYARFSQFLPRYRDVVEHLRTGAAHARHIGHNPLGALMVLALLGLIAGLGLTGAATLGSALKTGPLAAILPASQGHSWSEIHETAGLALLGLIVLHVVGVIFESRRSHENLARSMVTGRKARRGGDLTARPRPAHLLLASAVIAALVIGGAWAINAMSQRALAHPPVASMPGVYGDECAACHMGYHPSLRPAASWQLMMGRLDDHFGEDASLPADTRDDITAWLVSHAAETVDSKPAMLWADLSETAPVALPETETWRHIHDDVPEDVFRRRSVYSRSNCAACHRDAETGWFSPFQISVPKETQE